METTIRHFQPADKPALLEISADTAFFGDPVEAFLDDRRLFTDAFTAYYLEYEAPYAWVSETPAGLAGFLLGCADTTRQSRHWRSYILRYVLVKAIFGNYKLGKKTAGFAWGMFASMFRGEEAGVDLNAYPAHLQIDVRKGYRGEGMGSRLIEAYLQQLRQLHVIGVHLTTTSHNEAACHLYEKVGFRMLDERPNFFWTRLLGFEVNNRSYGMSLH
jgi:ribosomal protein S18 acetylase RimI-like enzyme